MATRATTRTTTNRTRSTISTTPTKRSTTPTPKVPKAGVRVITPALAQEWLDNNHPTNRPIRRGVVLDYARAMADGHWHLTGESIIFDTAGNLRNGQHRLLAAIEADTSFKSMVVHGVAAEAQKFMDAGAMRSAKDALSLANPDLADSTAISSVARSLLIYTTTKRPSRTEVIYFAEKNLALLIPAAQIARVTSRAIKGKIATYGVAAYILNQIDSEATQTFFESLQTGDSLSAGDPRLMLRNQLVKPQVNRLKTVKATGGHTYLTLLSELGTIFKAWNAWREGRDISHLYYRYNETFPQPH